MSYMSSSHQSNGVRDNDCVSCDLGDVFWSYWAGQISHLFPFWVLSKWLFVLPYIMLKKSLCNYDLFV